MPGLDGPSLYAAIRKRQGEGPPRVIFMTGNAALSADFLRDTREPILEKPFSLSAASATAVFLASGAILAGYAGWTGGP